MRYTTLIITALTLLNFSNAAPVALDNGLQIANQMDHKSYINVAKRSEEEGNEDEDGSEAPPPKDKGQDKGQGQQGGKSKDASKQKESGSPLGAVAGLGDGLPAVGSITDVTKLDGLPAVGGLGGGLPAVGSVTDVTKLDGLPAVGSVTDVTKLDGLPAVGSVTDAAKLAGGLDALGDVAKVADSVVPVNSATDLVSGSPIGNIV